MTHEEMDCEESVVIDESVWVEKEEANNLVKLHHVNFFEFAPRPVNCMAYDPLSKKMAVARFDAEAAYIEIWNTVRNWYHEQTLFSYPSIEAMVWHKSRLFCAGLAGHLVEFDLRTGRVKESISCNFGPIWCLAINKKENLIAAGTENGSVVFFEVLESEVKYKNVIARQGKILSICWHEELNLIITGGTDLLVWDVSTGSMVQKISATVSKDTKIWAVAVMSDFTIVTGDSTGHTTFFFGKPGHLSNRKRFLTHGADIHSISVSPRGDTVGVAGVDGMVTFKATMESMYEVEEEECNVERQKTWINEKKASHHLGDVKALQFVDNNTVVTAGFDCLMIIYNLQKKKLRKVSYIQQKGLVQVAKKARNILLQYPRSVELWSLGDSSQTGEQAGEILDLEKLEKKLLKINSKATVVSSCISTTGRVLFFSNESGTYGYWIKKAEVDVEQKIEVAPVPCPPDLARTISTHLLTSPNCNFVASVSNSRKLVLYSIEANMKRGLVSKHKLPKDTCVQDLKFNHKSSQVAVACSNHGVKIIDVKTGEVVCNLPKRESPVYSIDYHPINSEKIILSYMDATIAEMSTVTKTYTVRSTLWTSQWHQLFTNYLTKNHIGTKFRVTYDSLSVSSDMKNKKEKKVFAGDKLICQHEHGFTVVDWTMDLSKPPQKRKRGEEEPMNKCKVVRFKHTKMLFHVDTMSENSMVVVEKNVSNLMETFAPTFKKHKYGT